MLILRLRLLRPFLRFFFKLLYGPMAFTYDLVAAMVSLGRWRSWVLAALPYLTGPRILEVGHGPGHLQAALLEAGKVAVGLDFSPQMGQMAMKRLSNKQNPRLVRGAGQALPFLSVSFDQVVSTFPSEFIADKNTITEILRVLRPGGKAVIMLGAWITGRGLSDRGAAWLFRVTGQAPEWSDRYLAPLKDMGFDARVEWLEGRGSRILMIIAEKDY